MKFYIAAPWVRKDKAREARARLAAVGVECTSSWIDFESNEVGGPFGSASEETLRKEAIKDLRDIRKAGGLIILNEEGSVGGMHVETGYALGLNRPVFLVGPRTSVFHYHPGVAHVETLDQLIEAINAPNR